MSEKCEVCGGTEKVKIDGIFLCAACLREEGVVYVYQDEGFFIPYTNIVKEESCQE